LSFPKMILKDIRNVLFDKDIIVILLLGPIFLTLLFGGVYLNSYIEDIPIAALDEDGSSMSRMIIQQFNEDDRFKLKYNVKTRKELEAIIDSEKAHMGIYIPPNFSQNIIELKSPEVVILVNGSNMVVGNNAYAQAANIIQTISAGTQIKLIESRGIVPAIAENIGMPFRFNDRVLYDPKMTYMNYLIVGFIAVFLQQVMLSGIGIGLIKNGEDIARGDIFKKIMAKIIATSFWGLSSTFISIYIASRLFDIQIRGNMEIALIMAITFIFAISCPAIILAAIVKDKLKFTQVAFMLSLPTFATCGYVWTIDQMPEAMVKVIKAFWPLIYFSRPFDEIIIKGLKFNDIKQNIIQMLIYTIAWMPIGIYFFKKRYNKPEKAEA